VIRLAELSALRFPFSEPPLKTETVAGVTPNVNAKDKRKVPPPPGFTSSLLIAMSDDKILVPAVMVGALVDTDSG